MGVNRSLKILILVLLDQHQTWNSWSYNSTIFTFLRKLHTIAHIGYTMLLPTTAQKCSNFCTHHQNEKQPMEWEKIYIDCLIRS